MKAKILIADDSSINQILLADILGDEYEYLYASDGVQALEILEEQGDIDLLLLDIFMPKLDGFGVLEVIKQWNWTEELPVIIISSEDHADFIQKAYDLGVTDYIRRPFNMTVVQRRISNTLKLYSRQHHLMQVVETQVMEQSKSNTTLVNILSHVIESRNNEPDGHLLNVQKLTELLLHHLVQITDQYPLSEVDIYQIITISALHDIGKIGIPLSVLNKPGKLDPEEWEIMKSHTLIGDQLLQDIPIDQNEPLLRLTREIARWHHERWDGRGYPDGLKGDEIPISAQVVALADVYDALTSDRVYKKAYDHETAIQMIRNGECGAFNPLLLQCLDAVAQDMRDAKEKPDDFISSGNTMNHLITAIREDVNLPKHNRTNRLLSIWKEKSKFLSRQCGGIQFEYYRHLNKVVFSNWNEPESNRKKSIYLSENEPIILFSQEDWKRLEKMILEAKHGDPYLETRMLLQIRGSWRWHKISLRMLWTENSEACAGAVGQCTDIHQQVMDEAMNAMTVHNDNSWELLRIFQQMRKVFDVVRLVDPTTCHVMTFQDDGNLMETESYCYEIWGRCVACSNCSSVRALKENKWVSKLEMKDNSMHCVLSRSQNFFGRQCILEVTMRLDTEEFSGRNLVPGTAGAYLRNFYRDSVSNAYSRLYLDSFLPNLEHSDAVVFWDLDEFKSINDRYGHQIGDLAIRSTTDVILRRIQEEDKLIRYGGDEFILIFHSITQKELFRQIKRICTDIQNIRFSDHPDLKLDISYGYTYHVSPLSQAIHQADMMMYEMKTIKKQKRGRIDQV